MGKQLFFVKTRHLLMLLSILTTYSASAYDFLYVSEDENYFLAFNILSSNTVEVTSYNTYPQPAYDLYMTETINIPTHVYYEEFITGKIHGPFEVVRIGDRAFRGSQFMCSNLIIPETVKSIGDEAFLGCNLYSLHLPSSIDSISENAFGVGIIENLYISDLSKWLNLNWNGSISLPHGEDGTNSDGLYNLYINGEEANEIVIPTDIDEIRAFAFTGCKNITSIEFHPALKKIGDAAFWGCQNLTSLNIPKNVTEIGSSAFSECINLESVVIDGLVKSIEGGTFTNCSNLRYVNLPNTIKSIENYAFCDCSSLETVEWPDSITKIDYFAFYGCSSLTEAKFGEFLMEIGHHAFYECESLSSVIIPNSVKVIGDDAFYNCISIANLELGNSLIEIGERAFSGCGTNGGIIETLTLPATIKKIGSMAFKDVLGANMYFGCEADIYCYAKCSDIELGNNVFGGYQQFWTLHVKPEYANEYRAAEQWNAFNIVGDLVEGIIGDVDGSSIVDVDDVNAIINIILGQKSQTDFTGDADLDGSGIVDVDDVNAIINIILDKN